jgi:hypothetical protein
MKKVGILYICTGVYEIFWKEFYLSSEKYFLNNMNSISEKEVEKYYFVFTDSLHIFAENENKNIIKIQQTNLGWPDNTLLRFDMFLSQKDRLLEMDYIFFFNANLLFVDNISSLEFLPDKEKGENLLATLHHGFFNKKVEKFTYEKNPESEAFIDIKNGKNYFSGALNGGAPQSFLKACEEMSTKVHKDKEKNIIAIFWDESHWNKYLIGRKDVKILGPEYIYPENWNIKIHNKKKILSRDKDKYISIVNLRHANVSSLKKIFILVKRKIGKFLNRYGIRRY